MAAIADAETSLKPLLGTEEATLDSKGRILLSKKKRESLGEDFAMAIGEIGVLCVYPKQSWKQQCAEIERCDPMNPGRQHYQREFYGKSEADLSCDTNGRVVIPSRLRSYAKLKENILIVGCYDHIEIWDPAEYEIYEENPAIYGLKRRESFTNAYKTMRQ